MHSIRDAKREFLSAKAFGVVGASDLPHKFGHQCYRAYIQHGLKAYPVNPNCGTILGNQAYPNLASLPRKGRINFDYHTTCCDRKGRG